MMFDCPRLRPHLRQSSEHTYVYIDKRSHDDKSARVISKTLRPRALKLERFFHDKQEHSSTTFNSVIRCRQRALRHHRLAKKKRKMHWNKSGYLTHVA